MSHSKILPATGTMSLELHCKYSPQHNQSFDLWVHWDFVNKLSVPHLKTMLFVQKRKTINNILFSEWQTFYNKSSTIEGIYNMDKYGIMSKFPKSIGKVMKIQSLIATTIRCKVMKILFQNDKHSTIKKVFYNVQSAYLKYWSSNSLKISSRNKWISYNLYTLIYLLSFHRSFNVHPCLIQFVYKKGRLQVKDSKHTHA